MPVVSQSFRNLIAVIILTRHVSTISQCSSAEYAYDLKILPPFKN